jgi:nucleoid-associated protein YgaU
MKARDRRVGLISFGREAGIQLPQVASAGEGDARAARLCSAVEAHLGRLGLQAMDLELAFDAERAVLRVSGCAPDQDTRERIVLCCGNVCGVAAVDDRMLVQMPSDVSRWRFVQPGDTLAAIANDVYRDAARAPQLRAANQPLMGEAEDPQPGWLLRVP